VRRVDNLTAREGLDVLVNAAGYALVGVETLSKRGGPAPVRDQRVRLAECHARILATHA